MEWEMEKRRQRRFSSSYRIGITHQKDMRKLVYDLMITTSQQIRKQFLETIKHFKKYFIRKCSQMMRSHKSRHRF